MEIKARTTKYVKEGNGKRNDEKGKANQDLSAAVNQGDFELSQEIRLKLGKLEEELLLREYLKLNNFSDMETYNSQP